MMQDKVRDEGNNEIKQIIRRQNNYLNVNYNYHDNNNKVVFMNNNNNNNNSINNNNNNKHVSQH